MLDRYILNAKRPEKTFFGKLMLWSMNWGHNPVAVWGLDHLDLREKSHLLDIGCGGGKNILNLLKRAPDAVVCGIDYSSASVQRSKRINRRGLNEKRVEILQASVTSIPYKDSTFDGITTFESIYFWPDLINNLHEVLRVLQPGGFFMVCNETSQPEGNEKWMEMLHMPIYTGEELENHLQKAGFINVKRDEHKQRGWLCIIGENNEQKE